MGKTGIPYATKSWNWVHGCAPASKGCANCWARGVAETRLKGRGSYPEDEPFRVVVDWAKMGEPYSWQTPQVVFTSAMGDVAHHQVPRDARHQALAVVARTPWHTYLMFTKRVKELAEDLVDPETKRRVLWAAESLSDPRAGRSKCAPLWRAEDCPWPLPNVIVVASICTQDDADRLLPWLVKTPAAKRMVSLEPLLEEVNLQRWLKLYSHTGEPCCVDRPGWHPFGEHLVGTKYESQIPKPDIDGIIVGCESGSKRRPMEIEWARSLKDQAVAAGVAFYYKQAEIGGKVVVHPELDGRQWMEMPNARPS
jgi:protein gp37